jgi:hypothetical protein
MPTAMAACTPPQTAVRVSEVPMVRRSASLHFAAAESCLFIVQEGWVSSAGLSYWIFAISCVKLRGLGLRYTNCADELEI